MLGKDKDFAVFRLQVWLVANNLKDFKELVVNNKEGMRRVSGVLRMFGWLAIASMLLLVGYAVVLGKTINLGDGVFVLLLLGGLLLGGAYIIDGFFCTEVSDGGNNP
jgi:hypothetical protein